MITIKNDFTNQSITINEAKPLTRKKINRWRSLLCATECTSGDALGGRGRQDDPVAYAKLLDRAADIMISGPTK